MFSSSTAKSFRVEFSSCDPGRSRRRRQRGDFHALAFFNDHGHGAAAGVAKPIVTKLPGVPPAVGAGITLNFLYKHSALAEAVEGRGARGIDAFFNHRSLGILPVDLPGHGPVFRAPGSA